jgi:uracil-DNA glycosylase
MKGWQDLVDGWRASPAGMALEAFLAERRAAGALIYPHEPYRALALTPLAEVKVVILGQDPYHGPGQAEGLAFSVPPALKKLPPSLRNIFKELQRDLGLTPPTSGHLGAWAQRGVLLLNTSLTVEDGAPASHAKFRKGGGWEALTDALIARAAADPAPKVFMLWGAHAQAKAALIDQAAGAGQHLLLQANHPSPLSASRPPVPFIGCGHFSQAAAWLAARGRALDWSL